MSARAANGHAAESRCSAVEETKNRTGRHAPRTPRVTVTDPRIAVVESTEVADAAALATAITLLVKWAIRAHEFANPTNPEAPEAPTDHLSAD